MNGNLKFLVSLLFIQNSNKKPIKKTHITPIIMKILEANSLRTITKKKLKMKRSEKKRKEKTWVIKAN